VQDVVNYISFRLHAVGGPPASRALFNLEACAKIAAASGGIPRMINILCDTALVYGFARGEKTISASLVEDVIADKQQYSIFPLHPALAER
jgi:type II secretory pathway predicted ATPase ExeA